MMIGDLLYVNNDDNYESFTRQRAETIQLRASSRSFAIRISYLKETRTLCVFSSYVHSMNHTYAYSRDDRKIKFRMLSAQHFINEAPGSRTSR